MGPSLLVGVPSAVPALVRAGMWSPLSVLRACADTAPSTGLTGGPSGAALPAIFPSCVLPEWIQTLTHEAFQQFHIQLPEDFTN